MYHFIPWQKYAGEELYRNTALGADISDPGLHQSLKLNSSQTFGYSDLHPIFRTDWIFTTQIPKWL